MKDIWIILTVIAIVFGGNFLLKRYFETSGEEILQELEGLSQRDRNRQ